MGTIFYQRNRGMQGPVGGSDLRGARGGIGVAVVAVVGMVEVRRVDSTS